MHWLNMIVVAFIYAFVGSLIGLAYALLTGVDMSSRSNVAPFAALFGPVLLLVLAAMRKLMRERDIPIARAIYHTLLITFAAPVFLYGAQLIAAAASATRVAWAFERAFEVLKYWSAPLVFVFAVLYGIWRVIEHEEHRMRRASGPSGGPNGTPPSGSGNPGGQPTTAQHAKANGSSSESSGTLRRMAEVVG